MATHALIPLEWRKALNAVSEDCGTPQSRLVSLAVGRLLVRVQQGFTPDTPRMERGSLVALVARIPDEQQAALHELADRTRVRYSEWLRQAVVDVLREHNRMPAAPPPEPMPTPIRVVRADGRCDCGLRLAPGEAAPCEDCREEASNALGG